MAALHTLVIPVLAIAPLARAMPACSSDPCVDDGVGAGLIASLRVQDPEQPLEGRGSFGAFAFSQACVGFDSMTVAIPE